MNGVLKLQVTKANFIKEAICPYFVASVSPYKVYRSNVRNNEGKNPCWNEECQFQVTNGESELLIVFYSGQNEVFIFYI